MAVTDLYGSMVMLQGFVTQAPLQPVNVELLSGVWDSSTSVPEPNANWQVLPVQALPAGELLTPPPPVPARVTES